MGIKSLAVRGCRRITNGLELAHLLPNLEHLDLSWSGLVRLPDGHFPTSFSDTLSDDFDDGATLMDLEEGDRSSDTLVDEDPSDTRPWAHLRTLRLNGCAHLSLSSLTDFLCDPDVLPPRLETLLMTCLEPSLLTPYILQHMAFVRPLAYTTSTFIAQDWRLRAQRPPAYRCILVRRCHPRRRRNTQGPRSNPAGLVPRRQVRSTARGPHSRPHRSFRIGYRRRLPALHRIVYRR